ncbi:hypothetical protein H257_15069 [Aphanomyces astaci]|uniref:Uncharacterized protein n=2 Tax=Aphanomyces astaci TaxID=112090 RepID=W4FQM9_APHAT|nr:hypothetical protein H257_15069 [Aphanomyces astaci]ETV69099.1 hypothetical protein H257_15069 [Aphanomyces astaci]|eukprot:XP_009841352.1 hypothetical protein H257_15069 [Aphanomyces astaci]
MDLLGKLAQGGCAADGTVAARNPLSQALDGVLRAGPMGRAQQHHPSEAPPGQYTQMDIHQAMADAALHHMRDQPPPFHHHDPRTATHAPPQVDMNHVWLQEKIQRDAAHRQMDNAFQHSSAASTSAPMMQQSQDHRVEFAPQQQYMHHHHGPPSSYIQQQQQGLHHPPQMMPPPPPTFMQTQQLALEHQQHVAHVETVAKNDPSNTQRLSRDVASTMRQHGDARFHKSEFVQFMDALGSGRAELDDAGNTVVHHDSPTSELLADALDKDLTTLGGEDDAHDGGGLDVNALEQIWAKAMQEGQMLDPFQENGWSSTDHDAAHVAYEFSDTVNPYTSDANAFEVGCEQFRQGNLKEAILAFEASLQEAPDHSDAWRMLGECHAENDQDKQAISCLNRAVEEDPYNLDALLALGVSNVNELKSHGALTTLQLWVQHNPKFHGLQVQLDDAYGDGSLMDEVMQLMLQAQAFDPQDSDVQVVLGVLYNVSKDYDAAARSFRAAASARPEEYSLWNKLGATLANSSRSNEAIPSYHRALEIKPKYARGWLNLGISHANLGQYEDAAHCYLQALQQNDQADHIWSYLRIAFTCMERFDLVKLTDTKDVEAFRSEFQLVAL